MNAYVVLIFSLFIQICLGGLFAWSVFVPPLIDMYGFSAAQTQAVFGVTIAAFAIAMPLAGRLQARFGPRPVAFIGGLLFMIGYLLAATCRGSCAQIIFGVGVVGGTGIGFGYVSPLAICVKWFPRVKGFITGITVAGFGAGAIVLTSLATALFARGWNVLEVFRFIGLTYGGIIMFSALFLSAPDACPVEEGVTEMSPRQLLSHKPYWRLVVGMFCGTFAGLLVVGNIKVIGLSAGIGASIATLSIATFAVGNAAGRITWGHLSDKFGMIVVPLSLLFLSIAVLLLLPASMIPLAFVILSAAVGFGFGANFVVYVAQVASTFGIEAVGTVYPMVFFAYGLSGITGPVVGGWLYDRTGSYTASILLAAAVAGIGVLGTMLLTPKHE